MSEVAIAAGRIPGLSPSPGHSPTAHQPSLPSTRQLAGVRLARASEFLDAVGVRMFGNPSESLREMAMAGRAGATFATPYADFSRLTGVAV